MSEWTSADMMNVAAARELHDGDVCLVGVGPPNLAANLARRTHAPGCRLVYESGAIDARPKKLPLSIGDDDLAATATTVVSVPEMFNFWVGAGRIDVGFLGAAQIDRYGNINTTVIGDHDNPKVRLPGAGGAPEIAAAAGRVIVIVKQSPRTFVERVDFVSSVGYGPTGRERVARGAGPTLVITDHGVLEPDPETNELTLTRLHQGVTVEQAVKATGWPLKVADDIEAVPPPSDEELTALQKLRNREAVDA
ncbi:glutaconate CoA-transferase subunit B [Kribbella orskensis]|uniref:Glutaconate CoA-transferase subunit B n=1 Tax=Kribbella orskensis TaxID=2512216 RepID=A0ABY2BHN6_9ACTN|nr:MULTISPECIES: CoA-transferase [Kribbella]TCN36980.1 glutaconate CoA-transferase subunit B [Kribbella sp. VKM Ac-2500]TCO18405.1 glutaconate CoA-transferase subunit B [Kribbella orskensis]